MLLFYWNDKIALNLEQGYTVKVAFLLALSIYIYKPHPSLVLVQPRKTLPYISESLLMGRKESNQAKSGSI